MDLRKEFLSFAHSEKRITGAHLENYMEQNMRLMGIDENVSGDFSIPSMMTPNIVEERKMNVAVLDVFSRLQVDRIIYMGTAVTDYVANVISAQLLFLQSTDSKKDITLYINSPGGSVYAGLGIYDTMQFVTPEVATVCTGLAASMASCLLTSGQYGKRNSLRNARQMCHQPLAATNGRANDMMIAVKETFKVRDILYNIYSDHTGLSFKEIETLCDNGDRWLSADEAKELNFIDEILIGTKVIKNGKESSTPIQG